MFSIHDTLRILTESGFGPYETIAAATTHAPCVVGAMTGERNAGTIDVGKVVEMIL